MRWNPTVRRDLCARDHGRRAVRFRFWPNGPHRQPRNAQAAVANWWVDNPCAVGRLLFGAAIGESPSAPQVVAESAGQQGVNRGLMRSTRSTSIVVGTTAWHGPVVACVCGAPVWRCQASVLQALLAAMRWGGPLSLPGHLGGRVDGVPSRCTIPRAGGAISLSIRGIQRGALWPLPCRRAGAGSGGGVGCAPAGVIVAWQALAGSQMFNALTALNDHQIRECEQARAIMFLGSLGKLCRACVGRWCSRAAPAANDRPWSPACGNAPALECLNFWQRQCRVPWHSGCAACSCC